MRLGILTFLTIFISFYSFSQKKDLTIVFNPTFNNERIVLDQTYRYNNDTLEFSTLKFYISVINFYYNDSLVYSLKKEHHLVDISDKNSLIITEQINSTLPYNYITFNLGIDSTTNSSGAFGGDLDPTNGMYWTWQSGYINFKLEGKSTRCKSRNNVFQFHLGGYQHPFSSIQKIKLPVKNEHIIHINVVLDKFIDATDLNNISEVMSPSQQSVNLSNICSTIFEISK